MHVHACIQYSVRVYMYTVHYNILYDVLSPTQNDLNTSDFAELSAPLLYDMFKAHSEYPLHLAIQHQREDVVFLFLIEFNSQVREQL